ncbi:MAG: translation initiation factor IF-2 [Pseudomonadales bacterium]
MAEVTVSELAKVVGTPVDRLLGQMQQAGLSHDKEDQVVSDNDKKTLLSFLQRSHGETPTAPKKITLKRKTVSRLKTGSGQARKTVNVEVRKKRTYVKREELPEDEVVEAAEELEVTPVVEEPVAEVVEEAVEAEVEAPVEEEIVAQEPEPAPAPVEEAEVKPARKADFDAEALRVAAAGKRKAKEREEQARRDEANRKRLDLAEKERQRVAKEAAAATAAAQAKAKAPADGAAADPRYKRKDGRTDDDDTKPKKRSGGARKGKDKKSGHSLTRQAMLAAEEEEARVRRALAAQALGPVHSEHHKHGFEMPTEAIVHEVEIPESIKVSDLASRMSIKSGQLIKTLMGMGVMASINDYVDQDTAALVVEELGHKVRLQSGDSAEDKVEELLDVEGGTQESRAPVVTVMGHVDHGKTSLLDYIRKAKVADGEAGGITQHIGAYHVETDRGMISFLDTPGHAAFTAMRARGAQSTDIVILVVAADDGVMPQTEEAITHARAAGVPIVVAVNKIDKEGADPERVKNELSAKEVIPEDWGGDTQFIQVSAHTGQGIDELLDAVLLQSELLELTAARDVPAQGLVIESRLDKGRGPVASLLVQRGVLRSGDILLAGTAVGRVRAMLDENGKPISEAGPSIPIEILGLDATPNAGDLFLQVDSEKQAREIAEQREVKEREERVSNQRAVKLDDPFAMLQGGETKTLNVVLKADVRGSLEAIQSALMDLGNEEVKVNIISGGVGGITETDTSLALTSQAVVFGFNVRADGSARKMVEDESMDMRYYSVIYNLIDDVKAALSGMLAPELREEIIGVADVRDVFKSPKFGQVAGCMVVEGTVHRNKPIRVLRDNVVIFEGELESLRRFKDDVNDVRNGMECGIGVKNYDVKVGDKIEVFSVQEIARTL